MKEEIPSLEQLISYQDAEASGLPVIDDSIPEEVEETVVEETQAEGEETDLDTVEEETQEENTEETDENDTEETAEDAEETDESDDRRDEDSDDESESETESKENPYENYYEFLKEQGFLVLGDDFEFDGTPEKLEEAFTASETNKWELMKQKMLEKIPEEGKPLFNYFMAGGKDLKPYLETYGEIDYDTVDITNTKEQRKILREYYKRTSPYDDTKIERMIDKLESLDSLHEDAAEAVVELKELSKREKAKLIEETEQQAIEAERKYREDRNSIMSSVDNSEFIQDKRKNKVKAFLFNQITRGEDTTTEYNRVLSQISSNPEHIAQLADLLLDYNEKKGFVMDRFEKRGKSSATKSFRDTLESKLDPKSKLSGKGSTPKKEQVNWEELLMQMES